MKVQFVSVCLIVHGLGGCDRDIQLEKLVLHDVECMKKLIGWKVDEGSFLLLYWYCFS
jgi:hypothetical protein